MSFTLHTKVRFADVDPAGIVFYPRYFEMLNAAVEDWFAQMGADFNNMHLERHIGVPTVTLNTNFVKASQLYDPLDITITVTKLGRSSVSIDYLVSSAGEVRVTASAVLVCMDLKLKKSVAWPEDLQVQLNQALPTA
jgi:4-hydroxybenzoyl-CoA thioesterase